MNASLITLASAGASAFKAIQMSPPPASSTSTLSINRVDPTRDGAARPGPGKKALVVIAVEVRGRTIGRIRMKRGTDALADSLLTFVQHAVQPGSVVITDGLQSYRSLPKLGYRHDRRVLRGRGESTDALLPRGRVDQGRC